MTRIILAGESQRQHAHRLINEAERLSVLTIAKPKRSSQQNAKFHAICSDIAKSGYQWGGKKRTAAEWKVLLISGHTKATDGEVDLVPGLEGEFVNLRESSASMSVGRAASLITYALAFCDGNGIELNETREGGFLAQE